MAGEGRQRWTEDQNMQKEVLKKEKETETIKPNQTQVIGKTEFHIILYQKSKRNTPNAQTGDKAIAYCDNI